LPLRIEIVSLLYQNFVFEKKLLTASKSMKIKLITFFRLGLSFKFVPAYFEIVSINSRVKFFLSFFKICGCCLHQWAAYLALTLSTFGFIPG